MRHLISSIVLPSLTLLGAAVGGSFSLYIWWRSARTRHAEWLYSLYAKFYEDHFYKKTRLLLDYRPPGEIEQLYKGLDEGCFPDVSEPLVDYLNFFEFIAGLWTMHQLSLAEIRMLFQYYLDLLKIHPPVMRFIETQGFENLRSLINALGDYLFVYGTLRRENRHKMYRLLARNAALVGDATFRGCLYLVEDYPGAVPSSSPADIVRGEVYRLDRPEALLEKLDQYEEFDPESPDSSLYRRERAEVVLNDGRYLNAWIYVYNRPTDGLPQISSGDFLRSTPSRQ